MTAVRWIVERFGAAFRVGAVGLRAFGAGTGGFLRLGAPRCGSRARRLALRRLVRFADSLDY